MPEPLDDFPSEPLEALPAEAPDELSVEALPVEIPLVHPAPARPRGRPVCAWIVILGLVALILYLGTVPLHDLDTFGEVADPDEVISELQGRYLIGAAHVLGKQEKWYRQAQELDAGSIEQRLRFAILAGELAGPKEALQKLALLADEWDFPDADHLVADEGESAREDHPAWTHRVLVQLYRDYDHCRWDGPCLDALGRQRLTEELGWFGELALVPPGTSRITQRAGIIQVTRQTFFVVASLALLFLVLGLVGFVGLLVLFVLALSGWLPIGLRDVRQPSGVYAETFAVGLFLCIAFELLAIFIANKDSELLLLGLGIALSLSALVWPVIRGIPWRQVRQDIGWMAGRRPVFEPFLGLAGYAMSIPFLLVGLLFTLFLMRVQAEARNLSAWKPEPRQQMAKDPPDPEVGDEPIMKPPGDTDSLSLPEQEQQVEENASPTLIHPIVLEAVQADWRRRLQILVMVSILAPLVEETLFRGVLYRHLRWATRGLGFALSVLGSAALSSFLFAVIHPQGLVAVPALMGLAIGLCLVREWRETLIPCMVAHGVHNGLLMTVVFIVL